jgi:GNAT superfamily N-acetyltransferase
VFIGCFFAATPMQKRIYYKRHRMELDLRHSRPPAELPTGFYWLPWENGLLDLHAQVKYHSFIGEMDAHVFPCLASLSGCRDLMGAISSRHGFCPRATWLVAGKSRDQCIPYGRTSERVQYGFGPDICVATVQGLLDQDRFGGIQNLGVIPDYRGLGIGWALLLKALEGFAASGARRAFLEVTAKNEAAVRMYRRLGFRSYKTIYREVAIDEKVTSSDNRRENLDQVAQHFVALS